MSAQVIYLPTTYLPDFEETKRLEKWQQQLDLWKAELAYQQKLKRMSPGEIYQSKERFHYGVRDSWRVFQGLKGDKIKEA